jgi:ABC-type transport system involved in multi-copper enzyme maturation permease subunit
MIWLTWRQSRAQAAMMAAALAGLAVILGLTGPGLADDYSTGIAACTTQSSGCSAFVNRFFQDHQDPFLAVTAVVLVLPALIGLFWGAPLITRELEAGTHRLVWNQSITRTRWLAVKLGLTGLTAVTAAGLGSLAVTWWSSPIDKTAANNFARMEPLLFDARGIVPIAYAAFAFALGVTVGMLVRRTLPAMAITLAAFVAVQIAMPLLVRPHLIAPVSSTIEITESSLDGIMTPRGGGPVRAIVRAPETGAYTSAWVLSSQAVDASGHAVDTIPLSRSGSCAPPEGGPAQQPAGANPDDRLSACFAEIKRLGYRQQVTYQPSSRFWPFQWYETGIYAVLALGLAGLCFWRIRHRLS